MLVFEYYYNIMSFFIVMDILLFDVCCLGVGE